MMSEINLTEYCLLQNLQDAHCLCHMKVDLAGVTQTSNVSSAFTAKI